LVSAETKRYDAELRADTALKLEEIRGGVKLMDSRAARGHEATQAENELLHGAMEAERGRQHSSDEAAAARAAQSAQGSQPNGAA
jgi:hypothetical protein